MSNGLKKEIEKEFDKAKNYNTILTKIEGVSIMRKFKIRYALAPICVIVIAIIGFNQIGLFNQRTEQNVPQTSWNIKKVYIGENYIEESITIVPRWEEMSISQQFLEVEYNNSRYSSRITKILSDNIGKNIGTSTLEGYDSYTDTYYSKKGYLYTINNISDECAIAVKFEESSDYYVYVNSYYRPKTLEQFMKDLNLREIVSFGTIYYDYWYNDDKGNKQYENIEFPNVNDDIIWKMLFNDLTVKNVHSDNDWHNRVMGISVDIPLLGYKNISVSVSEDGYLTTNILDTGKTFYIGENKVKEFVNYVLENYEGYKIVYVDENGKEITDEEKTEDNVTEEIIMMENKIEGNTATNIDKDTGDSKGNRNVIEAYIPEN